MKLIDSNLYVSSSGQVVELNAIADLEVKAISERCFYIVELKMTIFRLKQIYYDKPTNYCNANTFGGYIVSLFNEIKNSFIGNDVILLGDNYIENSCILKPKTIIKNSKIINSQLNGELVIENSEITNSIISGNETIFNQNLQNQNYFVKEELKLPLKYKLIFNNEYNLWNFFYYYDNKIEGLTDITSYLSHEGTCRVYDTSRIINYSEIYDEAKVFKNSIINKSSICDDVSVSENSYIKNSWFFNEVNVINSKVLNSKTFAGYLKDNNYIKGIKI